MVNLEMAPTTSRERLPYRVTESEPFHSGQRITTDYFKVWSKSTTTFSLTSKWRHSHETTFKSLKAQKPVAARLWSSVEMLKSCRHRRSNLHSEKNCDSFCQFSIDTLNSFTSEPSLYWSFELNFCSWILFLLNLTFRMLKTEATTNWDFIEFFEGF